MTARLPILTALLLTLLAAPALADNAMLVIDSSASMAGKLGRDRKADLVADAVASAVTDFPTEAKIGMLAFGNVSKTSCSDAAVVVKPQQNGNDAVAQAAAALVPRGKAPLAVAIERAANALDYRKERATIVVFVDKIEACDADPCVLAESLKQKARDLTIEVIGLGLDDADSASVACIAEKTGGKFLNAKDGTDLGGGLTAALANAKAPPETLPTASLDAPAKVVQSDVFEVGYDGPKDKDDRIQISWPGLPPGSEIRSVLASPKGTKRSLTAPAEAGTYELRYYHPELNAVLATRVLDVAMRPVTVSAPARVPAGTPMTIGWTGPAAASDAIWITAANSETELASVGVRHNFKPVMLDAPLEPGLYEVHYHSAADNNTAAKVQFTVDPPAVTLTAPPSAPAGTRIDVAWTGPGGRFDDVVIARAGMASAEHVTMSRIRPDMASVRVTVPSEPGSYELRYVAGGGKAVFASVPFTAQ
ncbi:MAG TPA: VWA domain-containing protein [Kaistia sp.]|nr:VWA domain-containing protein [Kaistia sp.]